MSKMRRLINFGCQFQLLNNRLMVTLVIVFFSQLVVAQTPVEGVIYNVKNYGAIPVKDSINTIAIQRAIDACAADGGGTVYFAPGHYTSGQLYLKSNVHIVLSAGAILYASTNPDDFKKTKGIYEADNQQNTPNETCLLYADSVSNVSITGKGTIHGQAAHVREPLKKTDLFIERETMNAKQSGIEMKRYYANNPKVRLVFINKARNITVRDITLKESPDWGLHIGNADNVLIEGVTILSSLEKGVNSDGIDIDGCRNVRISNCNISTGDDAICLKSTLREGAFNSCENIVINNCTLESTSTALKIGTETHGDFRGIIFSNCVIRNSNRGISIVVRDGATVENILFTNLIIDCNRKDFYWWGDGDPIRFILLKRDTASRLGTIKNVTVRNVVAKGQGSSLIQGFPDRHLENIRFENVAITLEAESLPDKRTTDLLAFKWIKGLKLQNVQLSWDTAKGIESKWAAALNVLQCENVQLRQLDFQTSIGHRKLIKLDHVNRGVIEQINAWNSSAKNLIDENKCNQLLIKDLQTKETFKIKTKTKTKTK